MEGKQNQLTDLGILRTLKIPVFCLVDANASDYFLAPSRIAFHHFRKLPFSVGSCSLPTWLQGT